MYAQNDLKEVQMVLLKNNKNNQYTTYNYPLITKVNARHQQFLRIFETMYSRMKCGEQNADKSKKSEGSKP
jgi:hypothetical protein